MRRILFCFFFTGIFISFTQNVAASCSCGVVVERVYSQTASTFHQPVLADLETILKRLEAMGKSSANIAEGAKGSSQAQEKMQTEALIAALNSALNTHRLAERAMDYNEDLKLGKTPTQLLDGTNCGQDQQSERGSGMGVGASTASKVSAAIKKNLNRTAVYERGRDQLANLRHAVEKLQLDKKASLKPENGLTYTEDEFEATQVLHGTAMDPVATLDVSKANMDPDEKKEAEAYQKLREAQSEPNRQALADYMALLSPTLPLGSHVRKLYEESKSGLTYPESTAQSGKVSQMELYTAFGFWVNSPGYQERLRSSNVPAALLETANMNYVVNLEILKTLRNISMQLTVTPEARREVEEKLARVGRHGE